jgi:hypothetical protein
MLYDLTNPHKSRRIFYDGSPPQQITVEAGETIEAIPLTPMAVARLNGLEILQATPHDPNRPKADGTTTRPAIVLDGRYGIGDAIHQRGVLREVMRTHTVWLRTCHFRVYEDLVEQGLKLVFKPCNLHAQRKTIERERAFFPHAEEPPASAPRIDLSYNKIEIDKHGSILEAMAGCVGVKARPLDFSLPVRLAWVSEFRRRFTLDTGGRPLMVYRPIVQRREWNGGNRNPDPAAYEALFKLVRDGFFVVSVADLIPDVEWLVGPEQSADVKLHAGELTFEDMAVLWQSAAICFCNAGFGPVLAQAVGTPSITVYGGRERFDTTQRAGAHLAPTLGIDKDRPCDCMNERHDCGPKTITLPPAIERAKAFVAAQRRRQEGLGDAQDHVRAAEVDRRSAARGRSDILIFATTYVDSGDREILTRQWLDLHTALNPDCDFLLVDSASPKPVLDETWAAKFKEDPQRFRLYNFGDNVGHLSRHGRDGWGRAFCYGLDYAVEHGYAHVLHIEGDSLLRIPARDLVAKLKRSGKGCASITVRGTTREIPGWVETGLMCFSTDYIRRSNFSSVYAWPTREVRPTPEFVVFKMVAHDLLILDDLKGLRGDKNQISAANIVAMDLDWVTHCHSDIDVYAHFVDHNLHRLQQASLPESRTKDEQGENRPCSLPANVAVVVGGSPSVWQEIDATDALLAECGLNARWFVTNDMIGRFPGACTAITLHPQKIGGWLSERVKAGFPMPDQVWSHTRHEDVTNATEDWRGSSGLFGVKVARQLGFDRIILAGVPMEAGAGHFVRGAAPWKAADQFMGGWRQRQSEIAPFVRSWSGWTAKSFGQPSLAFLEAKAGSGLALLA